MSLNFRAWLFPWENGSQWRRHSIPRKSNTNICLPIIVRTLITHTVSCDTLTHSHDNFYFFKINAQCDVIWKQKKMVVVEVKLWFISVFLEKSWFQKLSKFVVSSIDFWILNNLHRFNEWDFLIKPMVLELLYFFWKIKILITFKICTFLHCFRWIFWFWATFKEWNFLTEPIVYNLHVFTKISDFWLITLLI